ncbi:FHA domain-containing protein [Ornithinibacillus sp. 179-J 7C1 HS]|uniref:FHA domain-containing protein n=1 Tax=Ornithinibacillus sp. 179-J 7C1 HS TaxID=3142384 RepID=UPI0039A2BF77
MGVLTEYGAIRNITSGSNANIAYVLHDNNDFSLTEYKVLQSQYNTGFIKCMQMMYNGKIELYYLTSEYKTFSSMLPTLDDKGFKTVMVNLLNAIIEVKNNGFLSYQKIDISFDHIFIHPSNLSVGLIYVPITIREFKDYATFETEFRTSLVQFINSLPTLRSQRISDFYTGLSNGTLPLEALVSRIMYSTPRTEKESYESKVPMILEALNAPETLELSVNKETFIIGKSTIDADGVISFNSAISRTHCKITQTSRGFQLEDLQSTNGTYLNNVRLQAFEPVGLKNGDVIRLANTDFRVRMMDR